MNALYSQLVPRAVPDDWYGKLFDFRYALIDQIRKPRHLASCEAKSIIQLTGIEPPGPVLDMACGYGRHCLAFAQDKFLVHGIDQSGELLSQARKSLTGKLGLVTLKQADLTTLNWPRNEYRLALCLDTSWGYCATHNEDMSILDGAFRALEPGGWLVFEQVNFSAKHVRWRLNEEFRLSDNLLYRKNSRLLDNMRLWVGSYEYRSGSRQIRYPFRVRLHTAQDLIGILVHVGFRRLDISLLGNLSGSGFHAARSSAMILIAKKPNIYKTHGRRRGENYESRPK